MSGKDVALILVALVAGAAAGAGTVVLLVRFNVPVGLPARQAA